MKTLHAYRHLCTGVTLPLACILLLQAGFILFLKSGTAEFLTGHPLAGRLHYGPEPFMAAVILTIFILLIAEQQPEQSKKPIAIRQVGFGMIAWIGLGLIALITAHPPVQWAGVFDGMDGTAVHPTFFAAVRYSIIMAMLVPAMFACLPSEWLRKNNRILLLAGGALTAYLWLSVLRIALHRPLAQLLMTAVSALLRIFSDNVGAELQNLTLTVGNFSAVIGPQCLGLDGLVLFLCVWPLLCILAGRRQPITGSRMLAGLAIGCGTLIMLNIVRIALIMIVGSLMPDMGVELFHDTSGALLFFLVIFAVFPLLKNAKNP